METRQQGTSTKKADKALYWNNTGRINCGDHIPFKGSDTWANEGWMRIPSFVVAEHELTCETCQNMP